jgi:hypothetical protein
MASGPISGRAKSTSTPRATTKTPTKAPAPSKPETPFKPQEKKPTGFNLGDAFEKAVNKAKDVVKTVADVAQQATKPPPPPKPEDVGQFLKDAAHKALDLAEKVVGKDVVDNVRPYVDKPQDLLKAGELMARGILVVAGEALSDNVPGGEALKRKIDEAMNTPPPAAPFPEASSLPVAANPPDATYQPTSGPLWGSGPQPSQDVKQSATLGDCYLMASLASLSPEAAKDMVRDNQDGTYTVRLYAPNDQGKLEPTFVRVTGDLPTPPHAGYDDNQKWVAIVEKAAAAQAGSYSALAGDQNTTYFNTPTLVSGRPTVAYYAPATGADTVYDRIQAADSQGRPIFVGTFDPVEGTYANHAYSVLGVRTDENGQRYVELRNPWGYSESGNDGNNDGIFEMKLEDFVKNFPFMAVAGG